MPGLVPGIHDFLYASKTWMAGTSPAMTATGTVMSDIEQLETKTLSDITAAPDEAALEALRVATLGKSGSVSALLKTLGGMSR